MAKEAVEVETNEPEVVETEKKEPEVVEVDAGTNVVPAGNGRVVEVQSSYTQVEEDSNIVEFVNTYSFEGKSINSIDLSGIDNLSAKDMIEANRVLDRGGNFSFMPEMTLEYACVIASKATGIPQEFFYALKPKDAARMKNRVVGFFFGRE